MRTSTLATLLFSLLFISLSKNVSSQAVACSWAHSMDCPNPTYQDKISDMKSDAQGNIYCVGVAIYTEFEFNGTLTGTEVPGENSLFIMKVSPDGILQWSKFFGGTAGVSANTINFDGNGNIILSGRTIDEGTFNFDGVSSINHGNYDVFVLSLNSSGDLNWLRTFGSTGPDYIYGIAVDHNDDISFVARFNESVIYTNDDNTTLTGGSGMFVGKIGSNGSVLWSEYIPGNIYGVALMANANNELLITGNYGGAEMTFSGGTMSNSNLPAIFICKLSSDGQFVWSKSWSANANSDARGIGFDSAGNIVLITHHYEVLFDWDDIHLDSGGFTFSSLVKLDEEANVIWAVICIDDKLNAEQLDISASDEIVVLGRTNCPSFHVGNYIESCHGGDEAIFAVYDTDGNELWGKAIGGSSSDYPSAVAYDMAGNILISGSLLSAEAVIDGFTLTNPAPISSGMPYLAKFGDITSVAESNVGKLKLFPNPTSNELYIAFEQRQQSLQLQITDASGRLVHSEVMNGSLWEYNVSNLAPGFYTVKGFDKNNYTFIEKWLVE